MADDGQLVVDADPPPLVQDGPVAKRLRKCRFCPSLVASGDALRDHEADCGGTLDLNRPQFAGAMPIGIGDHGMATFFAAGMSADMAKALAATSTVQQSDVKVQGTKHDENLGQLSGLEISC